MIKICVIIGTRPNLIKVDSQISDKKCKQVLIYTGQHFDNVMKDVFFDGLKLPKPDYDLGKTKIGEMIDSLMEVLNKEKPKLVIVYGDCNSSLAGALAAVYLKIPIAHVEAGERCGDLTMPEEVNRIMIDSIATYFFCSGITAVKNLYNERKIDNVFNVGDVMFDTMYHIFPTTKPDNAYQYDLLTIHRQNNADNKEHLKDIFEAIGEYNFPTIFPIHPRTQKNIKKFRLKIPQNIKVIQPVGYKKMVNLTAYCRKVITDSGGLTKEGYWLFRPVIILRRETEWEEILKQKWAILVGWNKREIINALKNFEPKMLKTEHLRSYMDSQAKEKIREIIKMKIK